MLKRLFILLLLTAMSLIAFTTSASAHVTVTPKTAEAGSTVDLLFRVPNESVKANTIEVEAVFPTDHRPTAAYAALRSGWTADIDQSTGTVASVTWSGGKIAPGAADVFVLTTTLPKDTPRLQISVLQTYDDGSVSSWSDDTPEGADHDEGGKPAPVVSLTNSVAPATTTTIATTSTTTAAQSANGEAKKSSQWGSYLIVVGLAVAFATYIRIRRQRTSRSQDRP